MPIWSSEIKELEILHESFKGQLPNVEKELGQLLKTEDANVIMLYARRCLEVIITDLCECELLRDRGTEPLKGIIDKLKKERKVPANIITSMDHLNSLSAYGAHPKDFDPEQVKPVLINLDIIIKWYLKYKEPGSDIKVKPTEGFTHGIKSTENVKKNITISRKRLAGILGGSIGIIASVFAVLYFSNIIGKNRQAKELEKSIAVLPFINDSQDEENIYFINGVMEEVLINLQKIKDLRVISRNSVEQFRGPDKPSTPVIARRLGVNYIVEGSGQKYGNNLRLRIQLIEADNDRHLWAESYEHEIMDVKDIFSIQSRIARSIATELKAIMTPEELELIRKVPTENLTAYDIYQRGREEYSKYLSDNNNKEALEKAEEYYHKALDIDHEFASAYTGLARVYWNKYFWNEYFSENFMDSVLILADIALSYDNKTTEGYFLKGIYHFTKGDREKALEAYDNAIRINPNSWEVYYQKSRLFYNDKPVPFLENLHKAASLNRGEELPALLRGIAGAYNWAGFSELARNYITEAYELDGDSIMYLRTLASFENGRGNYNEAIKYFEKVNSIDSTSGFVNRELATNYGWIGQYTKSLWYFRKHIKQLEERGSLNINQMHRIGYAFWKNGYEKEADYYFDKQMEYCNNLIKSERPYARNHYTYYDRAGVFAFRGDKEKAYEDLKIFSQRDSFGTWIVSMIKIDPLFDSIRDEPEFKQIVSNMEAKHQAEHERVRKWIEEQGML